MYVHTLCTLCNMFQAMRHAENAILRDFPLSLVRSTKSESDFLYLSILSLVGFFVCVLWATALVLQFEFDSSSGPQIMCNKFLCIANYTRRLKQLRRRRRLPETDQRASPILIAPRAISLAVSFSFFGNEMMEELFPLFAAAFVHSLTELRGDENFAISDRAEMEKFRTWHSPSHGCQKLETFQSLNKKIILLLALSCWKKFVHIRI